MEYRFGRDNFQEAIKMTRKLETKAQDWAAFKYVVFDVPNSQAPYRERYAQLGKYLIGLH